MTGVALEPDQAPTPLSRDLIALTKPRIISLLLVTTVAPMYAAGSPTWLSVLLVTIGGYLMAGGANAVNMYLDRDIDNIMARTRLRPIPSGRMSPIQVLAFGVACATFATWMLAHFVNVLTAGLALAGFYFYVFIYTRWLKRSSPQNIVIGGAAGAVPPLVGWAAVTGTLDVSALCLFLIVFYWTPPHFWALALYRREEYAKAGVPMLPVTHGEKFTRLNLLLYTIILVACSLLPFAAKLSGLIYLVAALALGAGFMFYAIKIYREYSDALARRTFRYSIVYLTALFAALLVDHYLRITL